ncbi:MAG: hypothetical protein LBO21_05705 [Synergistaceae bacterium]|jgi:hypothetical protein|nr:hypothetical protein [Synergistaceae bacterium]
MALNSALGEKNEMLSLSSTPKEMLRALYFYGVDHLILNLNRRELLLHKDQLIALLEHGGADSTISELTSRTAGEQMSARGEIEEVPQNTPLLLFSQTRRDGGGPKLELVKITFREYRERKIRENTIVLPEWWSIPLPILHVTEDSIFLNDKAQGLVPGGAMSLASQMDRIRDDRIVTLSGDEGDRTFSLFALTDDSYLIEDISGDFEMAEDLVWWAAVGRALVRRMEDEGLTVKRLSSYEKPPEDAAEVIQCSWDGEVLGSLVVDFPEGGLDGTQPEAEREGEGRHSKDDDLNPEDALESQDEPVEDEPAESPEEDIEETLDSPDEADADPDAEDSKRIRPGDTLHGDRDIEARAKDEDAESPPEEPAGGHGSAEGSLPASDHSGAADSIRKNEARTAYGGKKHESKGRPFGVPMRTADENKADERAKNRDDGRAKKAAFPVITPVRMRRLEHDPYDKGKSHDDEREKPEGTAEAGKDNKRDPVS